MEIDFTDIIIAVIGVIISIIARYIAPPAVAWLREKRLYNAASVLVNAAKTYFADGSGAAKLEYCTEQLKNKYGKYFDIDEITAAIQAAYVDLKAKFGENPSPAAVVESEEDNENSAN